MASATTSRVIILATRYWGLNTLVSTIHGYRRATIAVGRVAWHGGESTKAPFLHPVPHTITKCPAKNKEYTTMHITHITTCTHSSRNTPKASKDGGSKNAQTNKWPSPTLRGRATPSSPKNKAHQHLPTFHACITPSHPPQHAEQLTPRPKSLLMNSAISQFLTVETPPLSFYSPLRLHK